MHIKPSFFYATQSVGRAFPRGAWNEIPAMSKFHEIQSAYLANVGITTIMLALAGCA